MQGCMSADSENKGNLFSMLPKRLIFFGASPEQASGLHSSSHRLGAPRGEAQGTGMSWDPFLGAYHSSLLKVQEQPEEWRTREQGRQHSTRLLLALRYLHVHGRAVTTA